ncbi:MAG: Gluconolactonase [Polyangiaceae bacterium]|nr:Gluconolactonase [Polyangiaceae bacterium]
MREVAPLFVQYCQSCHSSSAPAGDLSLEGFEDEAVATRDLELVENILGRIELREMPPPPFPSPPARLVTAFSEWVKRLRQENDCRVTAEPGFAPLQRRPAGQLARSLRQALSLPQSYDFESLLGRDDSIEGFTNVGETLTIDADFASRYLDAVVAGVDYALRGTETTSYRALMYCADEDETTCANHLVERFLTRAYRRAAEPAELDEVLRLFRAERERGTFEDAMKTVLGTAFLSPAFMMRVELDGGQPEPHALSPRELASRLSYFLWSEPPDDSLLAAADAGLLGTDRGLEQQVTRMLRSPKRDALVDGFAAEWLSLNALAQADGIPEELKASMIGETKDFVREVLFNEGRSLRELLHADFTFVDDVMAAHYGWRSPGGTRMRVSTVGTPRTGGLLTHASLLAVTSAPTQASIVKRGAFVLSRFLCAAPPPPPPDAESTGGTVDPSASRRDQLIQHRADPSCASCHATMDPIGLGLEHFDRLGAYREAEDGEAHLPIDASGQLPSGETFSNASELAQALSTHPRFVRCFSEKLLSYALGRRLAAGDRCYPSHFAELGPDVAFSALVSEVVKSRSFRMRSPELDQ